MARLLALIAGAAAATSAAGCAMMFTEKLPSGYTTDQTPRCTTNTTAAAIDGAFAAVYLLTGIVLAAADEGGVAAAPLLAGGVHTASAIGGALGTSRCKQVRVEHDALVAALQRDSLRRAEGPAAPAALDGEPEPQETEEAAAAADPPEPPRVPPSDDPWGDFWQPM
jgi:hypothetical protein